MDAADVTDSVITAEHHGVCMVKTFALQLMPEYSCGEFMLSTPAGYASE